MSSDALRDPFAVGVKVTAIVQLRPAARLVPQLLVCVKSVALGPLMAKPENVSVVPPTFVSLTLEGGRVVPTFCGGKTSEVVDRLTSVPTPNSNDLRRRASIVLDGDSSHAIANHRRIEPHRDGACRPQRRKYSSD